MNSRSVAVDDVPNTPAREQSGLHAWRLALPQEDDMQIPGIRLKCPAFALLLASSLLFSGCIQVGLDSDFSNPDQIRHTLAYTIDRANIGQVQQSGGPLGNALTNQDVVRHQAQNQGFQFEPINTADSVGARISTTMTAQQNSLGVLLNNFLTNAVPNGPTQQGFNGTFQRDGNTYKLNLVINADQVFAQPGGGNGLVPTSQIFDSFTVTARMPGTLNDTSGTLLPDGRIQWNVPVTGTTNITASSKVAGGSSLSTLRLAGIAGGALLIVVLVAGYVMMRRRAAAGTPA